MQCDLTALSAFYRRLEAILYCKIADNNTLVIQDSLDKLCLWSD